MKDYAKYSNRRGRGPGPLYKILLILCVLASLCGLVYLGKDLVGITKELGHSAVSEVEKAIEKPAAKTKTPAPVAKKPEQSAAVKPRFDFYTLLPKMKMSSTAEESPALPAPSTSNHAEVFVLQIASLQNPNAAEELIGRLNLLGVEAQTELVQKNGSSWIRILSKPYSNFKAAEAAQERLHQHHIESLLVKTKT